jgi:hypothetical protein
MSYRKQATQAEIDESDANVARLSRMSLSDFMRDFHSLTHAPLPPLKYPLRGRKQNTYKPAPVFAQPDTTTDYTPSGVVARYRPDDTIPPLNSKYYLTVYNDDGSCTRIENPGYAHLYPPFTPTSSDHKAG